MKTLEHIGALLFGILAVFAGGALLLCVQSFIMAQMVNR